MDKLTELSIFVEVANCGSFSAAAHKIGLSPSAVSKKITRMEQRLGCRLFNRTTRKLNITEGGNLYLKHCRDILEKIEVAEEELSGFYRDPKGLLTISSSPGYAQHCLIPQLPEFSIRYPKIEIKLLLSGETVDLVDSEIDIAIRLGKLKDSNLIARKVGEYRRIICASPDYLKRHGKPEIPADLKRHNCLRIATSNVFNSWSFSNGDEHYPASGNFISDTVDALYELAIAGGGIVRLAEFMVGKDISDGKLVPLLEAYNRETLQVHIVYPHREYVSGKVKAFIDFMLNIAPPEVS